MGCQLSSERLDRFIVLGSVKRRHPPIARECPKRWVPLPGLAKVIQREIKVAPSSEGYTEIVVRVADCRLEPAHKRLRLPPFLRRERGILCASVVGRKP